MALRKFGSTSLKVSSLAMGSMHFKWILSESECFKLLDFYFEAGGNFLDTSDMYAQWVEGFKGGESEIIIGKWIRTRKNRDKIILSSKVRAKMWDGIDGEGLGERHIIKACEDSLKRLKTDYLDLYISHWPDPETPIDETTSTYKKLIQQGKIRYIGLSNYSAPELKDALTKNDKDPASYTSIQSYYNLLHRYPFENEILPLIKQHNLAFTPYSPLAGGFLTGVYRKDQPIPDHPRAQFAVEKMTQYNLNLIDTLEQIGNKYGKTISQVVLAWMLSNEWITSIILGSENVAQLEEGLLATEFILSQSDIIAINKLTTSNPT